MPPSRPPRTHGDDPHRTAYASHDPHAPRPSHEPPPARRRRRRAVVAGVLLALVLLPVAVDRAVAARVESNTARAFQRGMNTPQPPEVHVRGFPVLTQAASGTLDRVDITAHDIPASGSGRPLPVSALAVRLEGLTKSDDDSTARARSAEATASLSYADVSDALGLEVSEGDRPGQVRAAVRLPPGREITVTTTVSALTGNRVAFTGFTVTGSALPGAGGALPGKLFERPIALRNIPDGLLLRSVTTTKDGLDARFSGRSVTFRPDGATADGTSARGT